MFLYSLLYLVYVCRIYENMYFDTKKKKKLLHYFPKTPKETLSKTRSKHTEIYLQKQLLELNIKIKDRNTKEKLQNKITPGTRYLIYRRMLRACKFDQKRFSFHRIVSRVDMPFVCVCVF